MPSGVYTTIRLDPFYQEFLRGHFKQRDPVFIFPKGHDLLIRLERYLTRPPEGFVPRDFGDHTFRIEIPFMDHKNANYYFFMSEAKNKLYGTRIREYFKDIFHEEAGRSRRKFRLTKQEAIVCFMEDKEISPRYEDRLIKEYQRYLISERVSKHRKKKH